MKRLTQIGISGLVITTALSLVLIVSNGLVGLTKVSAVSRQQRTHEMVARSVPTDAVKFREVRNLQSSVFPEDLEIEFENISDKPIYFMSVSLTFPESGPFTPTGVPLGFSLDYGARRLVDISNIATSQDKFLEPGRRCILKFNAAQTKGFQRLIERGFDNNGQGKVPMAALSKIKILFQALSFGNGTGYYLSHPYPNRPVKIQGGPISETISSKNLEWFSLNDRFGKFTSWRYTQGSFLNFMPGLSVGRAKNSEGTECSHQKLVEEQVCIDDNYETCPQNLARGDTQAPLMKFPTQTPTTCNGINCSFDTLDECPPLIQ